MKRMTQQSQANLSRWARAYRAAYSANFIMLIVGTFAAAARQRFGAYLLIAYLVLQAGFHVGIGLFGYREAMGRRWPAVSSLPDDDDDDW
jgi:hypothetical protein